MASVWTPLSHYLKREVLEEIASWLKGRWVALEGRRSGERIFVRNEKGKPISVSSASDLQKLLLKHRWVRAIYGSLNVYSKLETPSDTETLPNIVGSTPSWDVDASIDRWKVAIDVAKVVVEELEKLGVSKSVYLVWSGNGIHVHVSEKALSEEAKQFIHPFDAAYAIVEYVLRRARPRIAEIIKKVDVGIKVENLVDLKRVFTAPLSIHRELDVVAICFYPEDMESFDISWTDPKGFKHRWRCWERYEVGELDELVERAVKEVGIKSLELGVPHAKRSVVSAESLAPSEARVGRFEVMALLQAARYYLLTGDMDKAKSFGLNRAIFYAWAKYYGPHGRHARFVAYRPREGASRSTQKKFVKVFGTEEVPVSDRGWFEMGGKEQLPEDFDRVVKSKLEVVAPWEVVWSRTIEYLKKFPTSVLKDPQKFYKYVYEPVRDRFVEKVLGRKESGGGGLLSFVKRGSKEPNNSSQSSNP